MATPAPLAFIEAFMSAIHLHQLRDPRRILNLMCAVEFQPAAPERMPSEYLVVRGADLDARHPLELDDANTMICLRISFARVGSVEWRIVATQVEGHKGPQTREQHRHGGADIPRHSEVGAIGVRQAQFGSCASFQVQLLPSLRPGLG